MRSTIRLFLAASLLAAVPLLPALPAAVQPASAQPAPKAILAWAPKPAALAPYSGPNKPLWKLSGLLTRHAGQQDWSETVVETRDFVGQYISMAPGEKTKTLFYADDRVFWVVQAGEIRFTIEGQQPFVAAKGFLVQVPYRVPFSLESVGNAPSLRFEVKPNEAPIYPVAETPASIAGVQYIKAAYRGHGAYDEVNKPYLDFEKTIVRDGGHVPGVVAKDAYMSVEIFRGGPVPAPPPSDFGHFRANFPGCWFVLEGKEDFLIEGEAPFTAEQGDVVFAPTGRWHRVTAGGTGISTRLAINARPGNLHWYQPGAAGGE